MLLHENLKLLYDKENLLMEKEQHIKEITNELSKIYYSSKWKFIKKVENLLYKIKLINFLKSIILLKREGFKPFLQKVKGAIKKIIQLAVMRNIKKRNLNVANNSYDIIFFPIIDWHTRYQRPQHIATGLSDKGHRVFYLRVGLTKRKRLQVYNIKKNIYEIVLPADENISIYNQDISSHIKTIENAIDNLINIFSIKHFISFVEFPTWQPVVSYFKKVN